MERIVLPMPDEKALLKRLRAGDEKAFGEIYHTYKIQLAKNIFRLLKSPELTEETLQDLFLKLWHHRQQIDPEQPIRAYLFRIAENLVYDLFRKAERDKKMQEYFRGNHSEIYHHIEERIFNKENRELLNKAIDLLPPQRRKVFTLCKIEEKSYDEVSHMLGISVTTVNDHVSKANVFLKEHFSSQSGLAFFLLATMLIQGV